jgi:GntR family transcriptional regulator
LALEQDYQQVSTDRMPLAQRTGAQLREMILSGALEPGQQLPSEPELAGRLNISRSTLRSAIQSLEREGFIIRRRGIGTFVIRNPIKVNNLNLNWGVTQVIRSGGAEPGSLEIEVRSQPADARIARKLDLEAGHPMVVLERVRTADGRRVVYSIDYLPRHIAEEAGVMDVEPAMRDFLLKEQSMYRFLSEVLQIEIHHSMAVIKPKNADRLLSQKLDIPAGREILFLEQVEYTLHEQPVLLADEYHVSDAFEFSIYRTV